ncbi:glycosyltransferase family 4 protein [Cohnella suwonensis]|uniref:Glycosyltransferase family 4 protein n=1 Tax=Cohnella suwonensis TaxID=696072 RepID=A0ABW0M4T6_9BACL
MKKPVAVYITNIPVPYRYRLYQSFCNTPEFEGWIFFDSLSYGETWASQMDHGVKYEVLGGKSIRSETGKTPINFKLIRQLWSKSPDIVVLTDFSPLLIVQTLLYLLFARKQVKLISMTDENRDFFQKLSFQWIRLWFRKIILRYSAACICCSENSRKHIESISKKMKGKTIVSYLTPEASYYEKSTLSGTGQERIDILTVCRLVDLKKVDRVIKAVKILHERNDKKNWKVTIVGDGPEEENLKQLVSSLGLDERVFFLGRLIGKEVQNVYAQSNIFMLTSYKEPWGVVVHEAMLKGLAPIVTKAVGASELVNHAGGIVIDDQVDEQSLILDLANSLEDLMNNPQKLKEIQQKSIQIANQITIDEEVATYLSAVR